MCFVTEDPNNREDYRTIIGIFHPSSRTFLLELSNPSHLDRYLSNGLYAGHEGAVEICCLCHTQVYFSKIPYIHTLEIGSHYEGLILTALHRKCIVDLDTTGYAWTELDRTLLL